MKKLILFLLVSVISTASVAQKSFEGFYGQFGLGYESTSSSASNVSEIFSSNPSVSYPLQPTISNINSFTQNIGIGYTAKITDQFLLGLGGDLNPISSSSGNFQLFNPNLGPAVQNSYKRTNSYNIFITPSYLLSNEGLIYAKVGYSGSQIEITAGSGTLSPGQVDKYNLSGYVLGAGYKQFIMGNVYGFIEGNYNKYQSTSISSASSNGSSSNSTSGNLNVSSYNFLVGIGYKF
jgi:opacity protein-like surface antigen